MSCGGCLFQPVNDYKKTGEDRFTWEWKRPCHGCMNTHYQPHFHRYVSVEEAIRLIELAQENSDE